MNGITLALIFVGGGIGSVLRYAIGLPFKLWNVSLPIGTLLANLSAAVIIGITFTFASTGTTMTTHRYRTEFITDVRMSGRRHRRRHRRGGRSGRY